ncbi:MAG: glycosyltransferase 87 family protein [Patescibacteria group bacterium]
MKNLTIWIIIAIVIRVVLSGTALHPDIRGHNLAGFLVAQRGQALSLYDYLSRQPRADPWVMLYRDDLFIYPPLAYLVHGLSNLVLYPLYPQALFNTLITDIGQVIGHPDLPRLLILLKFPYLVADIICFFIVRRLTVGKHQFAASLLWLFNPITIYASYMIGQFDIFLALFILLAIYFASTSRAFLPAIMLGLAASFKPFPLFLIPFLPGSKPKNIIIGILTYILLMTPYLGSTGYRQYALLAPQTDKITYSKILVSGSQYLPLFFLGLVVLFWLNHFFPKKLTTWEWFGAVGLLFFSLTHFHPQWFVWIAPSLVLWLATDQHKRLPILAILGSYCLLIFLFEPSLTFGLFNIDFSLFAAVNRFYPADHLASLARALFAGSAIAVFLSNRVVNKSM